MAYRDLSGRTLGQGKFVIREKIGTGGYADVYRGEEPLLKREVVIKVLHGSKLNDSEAQKRFKREAELASLLDHPCAAHIYAYGIDPQVDDDDEIAWIAMELVRGVTLHSWLVAHGPMPLEVLVPYFEGVAEVVQAAHDRGIVHRDLTPANMMGIERNGHILPRVLDFGIAKLEGWMQAQVDDAWTPTITDEAVTERIRVTPQRFAQPRTPRYPLPEQKITDRFCAIGSRP